MNKPYEYSESSKKLAERLSQLSPAKRALMEKRLGGELSQSDKSFTIPKATDQKLLPLSYAQQRLWFMEQLEPGSSLYHIPSAMRIKGNLNIQALENLFRPLLIAMNPYAPPLIPSMENQCR